MRSARSTDEKERQQGQGGTPKAHRRSRTRGGPQYAAVLCLGCAHRYPAHWTGERLCCPIAPGMPQLSLRQCPKIGHLLVALLPPITGLPLSSTTLRSFVAGIEQPENAHWHMSTTMLSVRTPSGTPVVASTATYTGGGLDGAQEDSRITATTSKYLSMYARYDCRAQRNGCAK